MKEAGLPDSVFNIVNGGKEVVEAISDNETIAAVGFVGSTKVAEIVYDRAGGTAKRVLCLGGAKNHLVVVPGADLEMTSSNVVASAFGCAGQRCMAASVMLAVGPVDPIIEGMKGHASNMTLGEEMGAIINAESMIGSPTTSMRPRRRGRRSSSMAGAPKSRVPTVIGLAPRSLTASPLRCRLR